MADKDKQPQQADFDKAWDNIRSGKGRLPYEDDMSPLPSKEEADTNRMSMEKALIKGAKEGPGGKKLGMKKGGKVKSSASKRADGIATKGKTKGRII